MEVWKALGDRQSFLVRIKGTYIQVGSSTVFHSQKCPGLDDKLFDHLCRERAVVSTGNVLMGETEAALESHPIP